MAKIIRTTGTGIIHRVLARFKPTHTDKRETVARWYDCDVSSRGL